MDKAMEDARVSVTEAAAVLGISRPTVRAWARRAGIPLDREDGRAPLRVADLAELRLLGARWTKKKAKAR